MIALLSPELAQNILSLVMKVTQAVQPVSIAIDSFLRSLSNFINVSSRAALYSPALKFSFLMNSYLKLSRTYSATSLPP